MNIRQEKGSMAVYVTIVLVSMVFILTAIFLISNSARKNQLKTAIKVKETYEADNDRADKIYDELVKNSTPKPPELPDGWDGNKVEPVESEDNVTIPVPIGYTASKATGENSVSGGFVIYEGTEAVTDENVAEAKTTRNQFVWVPVDDISKMAKVTSGKDANGRTNYQGKLYSFSSSGAREMTSYGQGTTSYREPDMVKEYDGSDATRDASYFKTVISSTMTAEQFKKQLQEEYNEMIASVDTYGGFYIGRYETGNLASSVGKEPVVVKENSSISNVNWYYMYQNSKLIKANENVVSTMIWGSMWDRTLIWLVETYEATDGKNGKSYAEIKNSTNWGNYSNNTEEGAGTKQKTGFKESWKANNIYDLAGNVYDWTIEAYSTYGRVIHGSYYYLSGSSDSVRLRDYRSPSLSGDGYGSRSALYIVL